MFLTAQFQVWMKQVERNRVRESRARRTNGSCAHHCVRLLCSCLSFKEYNAGDCTAHTAHPSSPLLLSPLTRTCWGTAMEEQVQEDVPEVQHTGQSSDQS